MSIFWVKPKGQGAGLKDGSSLANAIDGTKALKTLIDNGTIRGIHDIYFVGGFTLAEMVDWAGGSGSGVAAGTRLYANNPGNGGIWFGSSQGSTSTASGLRFHWSTPEGQAVFDMRGATSVAERMVAAFYARGEDITLINPHIYPGTWDYVGVNGTTRIAGSSASSDAENRSDENNGIILLGNGNVIDGGLIDGTLSTERFCRFGVLKGPSQKNVSNASAYKTGIIRNLIIKGVGSGGITQPFGGGSTANGDLYDLRPGTRELMYGVKISDGAWGYSSGRLSTTGGNAAKHGNGWGVSGRFFGGFEFYDSEITGQYQDGFGCGVAAGAVCRDNYIHDLNSQSVKWWIWNVSTGKWELDSVTDNTEGNGVKTGLLNKDGGSPSVWLGTDGVIPSNGDNCRVAELRNLILRNRIINVNGAGITSNMSRGCVYHANEIDGAHHAGILLVSMSGQNPANIWISHNFIRKVGLAYSNNADCLRIESQYRVWLYNNILWSDPNATAYDLYHGTSQAVVSKGNLLVTGRTRGNAYNGANDLASQTPSWTPGVGLHPSSPLRGAGTPDAFNARTYGMTRNRLKQRFDLTNPNVGPY